MFDLFSYHRIGDPVPSPGGPRIKGWARRRLKQPIAAGGAGKPRILGLEEAKIERDATSRVKALLGE